MVKTDCGLLIKQISDHIAKEANNTLRSSGMTLSQLRCLEYLYYRADTVPMKDIEAHFHITQPTVAGLISRLTQKGLVQLVRNPDNARAKNAKLTELGVEVYIKSEQHRDKTESTLLAPLSEDERSQFVRLLRKVNDSLESL